MNQPTDRMLIDALCITLAAHDRSIDLGNLSPVELAVFARARSIVAEYGKQALALISDEQKAKAKQAAQAPAVIELTPAEALFAGRGWLEINTRVQETIERLSLALRCKEPIKLDATGERVFLVTDITEDAVNHYSRIKLRLWRTDAPDTEEAP